ncbi:MAG: MarR family transcriptional regulator [Polyangiaceae bacterium]
MKANKRVGIEAEREEAALGLGAGLGFMRLLWSVAHGLESASKQMQAQVGVTGPQRLVIRIIGHYGHVSAGDLAHVLRLHPSSLTGVLRRLEQAGFIAREADPKDRRRAVLRLTKTGERLDAQRAGTVEAAVRAALSSLPEGMVRAAEDVLRQIASELALRWGQEGHAKAAPSAPRKATRAVSPRSKRRGAASQRLR